MRIIKEKDLSHEQFKAFDSDEGMLEIYRFEEPSGFMIVRKGADSFNITLSCDESMPEYDEVQKIIKPYLHGKTMISLSTTLTPLIQDLETQEFKEWFGMYNMSINHKLEPMKVGTLQGYKGESEIYSRIIGKAFEPMRKRHDFKPYDWYEANPEEAIKEFEEAEEKGKFYGYVVDDEIVGNAIVLGDEIDTLCIDEKHHKKGYGRELLKGVVNDLIDKGMETIKLSVVESNTHVYKLYTSEGFDTNHHKRFYKNY